MPRGVAKRPPAHPCSVCNKRFTKRSNLRIHERLHTGERPYVCRYHGCGKAYKWLSSINFHEGRCERRAFGLANTTGQGSAPGTGTGNGINRAGGGIGIGQPATALPSSPVTPVRGFSTELVLPPATTFKRIADATQAHAHNTQNAVGHPAVPSIVDATAPRRRHASMPMPLPPPMPPHRDPIPNGVAATATAASGVHPHQHHHQHQHQPSVLMQMARALPAAPLPLPHYPHNAYNAPALHHPHPQQHHAHAQHVQRLLSGVAAPVPVPGSGAAPTSLSLPLPTFHPNMHSKVEEDYAQAYTHSHSQHPSVNGNSNANINANTITTATAAGTTSTNTNTTTSTPANHQVFHQARSDQLQHPHPHHRPQCTVAGGVLDDLANNGYTFDNDTGHEVLLF